MWYHTGGHVTDAFIALGTEHGCEFCAEDLAPDAELSDEQLEAVAGGVVLLVILAAKSPNRSGGGTGFRVKLPMQG